MSSGWIKLHRKILDSSVFQNAKYFKVWVWCLMKATHKEVDFPFNGKDIKLQPGEFLTGRKVAAEELDISEQNFRSAMKYLISTNRLTSRSTNRFTVYSIVNWEEYQIDDEKVTSKVTKKVTNKQPPTNQPVTTNNNVKNVKNDKNTTVGTANADPVNEVMKVFYEINPTISFSNPFNRKAADELIKRFGVEKTVQIAQLAVSVQGQDFAPVITTPGKLRDKLADLRVFIQRQGGGKSNVVKL